MKANQAGAMTSEIPVVRGRPIPPSRPLTRFSCWTVEITCPYCGRRHLHGLGAEGDLWGHRVAHCVGGKPNPGYDIIPPEEVA